MNDSLLPDTPTPVAARGLNPAVITLSVLLLVGAVSGVGVIRWSNELVALETGADTQWKQVENQLERQYDLIPRLVEVVKQSAVYEERVLMKLAEARANYSNASALQRPARAAELDGVLGRTLAIVESYPDLQTNGQLRDLAYEIAGTQNRLALERKRYNDIVGAYNMRLKQLPWRLLAADDASPRDYYEPPQVKLVQPELGLDL